MASKKKPAQRRVDVVDNVEYISRHQPAVSNALRIKLDHLKTLEPLTENQR